MNWSVLLWLLGCGFGAWLLWRMVQGNPSAFSSQNLFKTLHTLGLLALGLIAFISVCVMLLRQNG